MVWLVGYIPTVAPKYTTALLTVVLVVAVVDVTEVARVAKVERVAGETSIRSSSTFSMRVELFKWLHP